MLKNTRIILRCWTWKQKHKYSEHWADEMCQSKRSENRKKNMSSDRIIVLEAIKSKQQIFELRPDKASVYMFVYAPIHSNTRTLTAPWTTFIQHTCSHTHTLEWGAVGEISRFHHYYCSCFSCSYHYNYDFGLLYFKKVHIFFSALVRALNLPLSLWENYQHRCPFPISRCSHIVHHSPCIDSGG